MMRKEFRAANPIQYRLNTEQQIISKISKFTSQQETDKLKKEDQLLSTSNVAMVHEIFTEFVNTGFIAPISVQQVDRSMIGDTFKRNG